MPDSTRFTERYAALRAAFLEGVEARLATLEAAWSAGDTAAVLRESHKLAGVCGSYGLDELQREADRLHGLAEGVGDPLCEDDFKCCLAALRRALTASLGR